jgi:hypothetical protein
VFDWEIVEEPSEGVLHLSIGTIPFPAEAGPHDFGGMSNMMISLNSGVTERRFVFFTPKSIDPRKICYSSNGTITIACNACNWKKTFMSGPQARKARQKHCGMGGQSVTGSNLCPMLKESGYVATRAEHGVRHIYII